MISLARAPALAAWPGTSVATTSPFFLVAWVVIVVGCAGPPPRHAVQRPAPSRLPDRPNIILITLDTVRFDATPLAKGDGGRMPFLSDLKRRAANFTETYSTWDETVVSHFTILTGYVSGYPTPLDTPQAALPYQLKRRGYRSFGVAANLQLSTRSNQVLRSFDDYLCIGDMWNDTSPAQKKDVLPALDARIAKFDGKPTDFNRLMVYASASRALTLFEHGIAEGPQPFFAFLNVTDAHDPYFPDPGDYDPQTAEEGIDHRGFDGDLRNRRIGAELRHPKRIADPKRRALVEATLAAVGGRAWSTTFDLDARQLRLYRLRYDAEVHELDRMFAALFGYLQKSHLLDSTIVIITADHGESFGEGNLITHAFNDHGDRESTRHVPLLFVFPPSMQYRGRTIDVLGTTADIAPTIYDLVRIDFRPLAKQAEPGNFGRSLLPYMRAAEAEAPVALAAAPAGQPAIDDRQRAEAERLHRLRALGYIN
jgi:arylsulfatase A-like enzyme